MVEVPQPHFQGRPKSHPLHPAGVGLFLDRIGPRTGPFFCYGIGGNGKGVLLGTWNGILGEYSAIAPMATFTATQNERHPTELAMLRGARLVTTQETEDGHHWAESKVKALTGGDPVSARFMRQEFFTYQPTFKLIVAGNHRPSLRNVDEAIRRRFNLVPFTVTIPPAERDPASQKN